MKIILPFVYPPIVDSFSGSAGVIGIMQTDERFNELIFANNYLITYDEKLQAPGFNWGYYNDDFCVGIDATNEGDGDEILSIIDLIKNNYYIHLIIDHYYIIKSDSFYIRHMTHDCATIIGFDDENKIFYVGDNFKNGKYTIEEISFNELAEARQGKNRLLFEKLTIVSDCNFHLSGEKLVCLLESYRDGECYLSSDDVNEKNMNAIADSIILYGSKIYGVLNKSVNELKEGKYDIRPFHVMYNHMCLYELLKKILLKRGIFINGYFSNVIEELISDSKRFRYIYLKLSMKWSENAKAKFMDELIQMHDNELKLISFLLEILNGYN